MQAARISIVQDAKLKTMPAYAEASALMKKEKISVNYEVLCPDASTSRWAMVKLGSEIIGLMKLVDGQDNMLHVMQTWVHRNHRNTGYYTRMWEAAVKFARSKDYVCIEGATNKKKVAAMMEGQGRKLYKAVYRYDLKKTK